MNIDINYVLFFIALALLSLVEIRYNNLSGAAVVFGGAVLMALVNASWLAIAVSLSNVWGPVRSWPDTMLLPALFHPNAWPIILTGTGVRHGLVGSNNLLVVGVLALVYPWPALVMSFVSLDLWRLWWSKRKQSTQIAALPGMLLGLGLFVVMNLFGIV